MKVTTKFLKEQIKNMHGLDVKRRSKRKFTYNDVTIMVADNGEKIKLNGAMDWRMFEDDDLDKVITINNDEKLFVLQPHEFGLPPEEFEFGIGFDDSQIPGEICDGVRMIFFFPESTTGSFENIDICMDMFGCGTIAGFDHYMRENGFIVDYVSEALCEFSHKDTSELVRSKDIDVIKDLLIKFGMKYDPDTCPYEG